MSDRILGVIFDLDGVIVSTDNCHYLAWKRMADEEGIYFDRKINERLRGVSRMESLEIILERAQRPYTGDEKQAMAARKNAYYVELIGSLTRADILPGALDTLSLLKERGVKVAIGSSSKNTPIILRQIGLENAFDAVADGNAITHSKPDPAYYEDVLRALDVRGEECLMVGNDATEDMAAREVGMDVFLLTDCLINAKNRDLNAYPRGDFAALNAYIDALQ